MARLKRIIHHVDRSCSLSTLLALLMMTTVLSCGRSKTGKNGGATPKKTDVTSNPAKNQSATGTFKFEVNKNTIHDGRTDFIISISPTGIAELKETDLAGLAVSIERTKGNYATIHGLSKGILSFKEIANKLTINTEKKVATKQLTILPNQDQNATFKLTLLDQHSTPIPNTEQTVEWNNGIELEVIQLAYNLTTKQIEYQIKNKGAAPTANVDLNWRRMDGATVTLDGNPQGKKALALDASNNKEQIGSLSVAWNTDTSAKFKFELTWNGVGVYKKELPFSQTGSSIKMALANPGLTTLVGETQKNIQLVFTALKQLSQTDLQSISLDYVAMHGALVISPKSEAIKGKNLHDLLGITSLANGATAALELTINNNNKHEVIFKEIKLKGSENEDAHKIAQIHWKGEVKIKLESKGDLTRLQGDGGKKISLKLTNESTFDLDKEVLEKVKIKLANLPTGASVHHAHQLIQDMKTTLWDLLGTQLAAGQTIHQNLNIVPGTNPLVNFTFGLQGENVSVAEHHPLPVNWKAAEIKVKAQGHNGYSAVDLTQLVGKSGKQFSIRFTNNSEVDLQETDLKKVVIELIGLPVGVLLKLGEEVIKSGETTLLDIYKRSLEKGRSFDKTFTIEPGTCTAVDFTLKLAGENKEAANQEVKISWKQGNGESEIKIVDANKKLIVANGQQKLEFELEFNNEGINDLDATALNNIKLNINGPHQPDGITFKRNKKLQSGITTLADLIGKTDLKAGSTKGVKLCIDPGTVSTLDFVIGLINTGSINRTRVINWNRKVSMKFTTPKMDGVTFTGTKGYVLKLTSDGDEVNSDDVMIKLIANNGAKFRLGDELVDEKGIELTKVIKQKHKKPINISKDKTVEILITSANTADKTASMVKIVIAYHSKKVTIRNLNWKG